MKKVQQKLYKVRGGKRMTENELRLSVVAAAKSFLGCKTGDSVHKSIIDKYNAHKPLARGYKVTYTDSWCATAASVAAIVAGLTKIIPTECSCGKMIELFKNLKSWEENDAYVPKPGDYVFYDWNDDGIGDNVGWPDHVGVVESISNNQIIVIEGNKNGVQARRTLTVNQKNIRGYGVPKYASLATEVKPSTSQTTSIKVGDVVSISAGATYYNNTKKVPSWVLALKWIVKSVSGNRVVIDKSTDGKHSIDSPIAANNLTVASASTIVNAYYGKYTGTSEKINEVFASIGVPEAYRGKWNTRIPVAKANGINNYEGTYEQNNKLISLAKAGKLKKV